MQKKIVDNKESFAALYDMDCGIGSTEEEALEDLKSALRKRRATTVIHYEVEIDENL